MSVRLPSFSISSYLSGRFTSWPPPCGSRSRGAGGSCGHPLQLAEDVSRVALRERYGLGYAVPLDPLILRHAHPVSDDGERLVGRAAALLVMQGASRGRVAVGNLAQQIAVGL